MLRSLRAGAPIRLHTCGNRAFIFFVWPCNCFHHHSSCSRPLPHTVYLNRSLHQAEELVRATCIHTADRSWACVCVLLSLIKVSRMYIASSSCHLPFLPSSVFSTAGFLGMCLV